MKHIFTLILISISTIIYAQGVDCGSASPLTVEISCTNTSFNFDGSNSIANPPCVSAALYDGWYSFSATETSTTIDLSSLGKDAAIAVYSDCSGTLVGGSNCANTNASTADETLTITTLASTTYYVRVLRIGSSGGGKMSGNICIHSVPSGGSGSSSCDYVLDMFDSAWDGWDGSSVDIEEDGVNIGSYSEQSGGGSTSVNISINNNSAIEIIYTDGTSWDSEVSFTLTDPFGNIVCSGNSPSSGSQCTFNSNCTGPNTPCSADQLAPQSSTCGSITYATYNNNSSTDSGIADPGCGSYGGADVWIKAEVPQSGGFDVITQSNGLTDMAMAVYSGTCSSLSLISCSTNGNGNMPTETVSGLNPGDSVFIRVWDEGGNATGTFDVVLDDPLPIYCEMGNAVDLPSAGENCVQLTDDASSQKGCVWNTSTLDLTQAFDYTLQIYLGDDDSGADGITFTFQNDPNGPTACGNDGEHLGIGGLTNSLTIEVDTYDNNSNSWEPSYDHISISKDGDVNDVVCGAVAATSSEANVEDGNEHDLRIVWNPAGPTLEIYFDNELRITCNEDIINTIFGGNSDVYWGFTASTGGLTNQQYFCPGNLPVSPLGLEFIDLDSECSNNTNVITWTTLDENNIDYYIVEKTLDGNTYSETGKIYAHNNSYNEYVFSDDKSSNSTQNYYRIKAVNKQGASSATSIVASKCNGTNENSFFINSENGNSTISFNANFKQNYSMKIHDIRGRVIWESASVSEKGRNNIQVDLSQFSNSVYIISYIDEQTAISKKFVLR